MLPTIVVLLTFWGIVRGLCPSAESLAPLCHCQDTSDGPMMSCKNVINPDDLLYPIQATARQDMFSLLIRNSTLLYLPDGLFRDTRFEKIRFLNTELMSLTDSEVAFSGLENTLTEIRATDAHYVAQWQWSQLHNLRKLDLIDVNQIEMDSLSEPFPSLPKLTALGIIRAKMGYIVDRAFAGLPMLKILELRGNRISELKRNMFPTPAEHLFIMQLDDNKLSTLPADIFKDMPSLTSVHLKNNKFSIIEEKSFSWAFENLEDLLLEGNNLRCDCRIKWIMGRRLPFNFDAHCSEPEELRGWPVKYIKTQSLWC